MNAASHVKILKMQEERREIMKVREVSNYSQRLLYNCRFVFLINAPHLKSGWCHGNQKIKFKLRVVISDDVTSQLDSEFASVSLINDLYSLVLVLFFDELVYWNTDLIAVDFACLTIFCLTCFVLLLGWNCATYFVFFGFQMYVIISHGCLNMYVCVWKRPNNQTFPCDLCTSFDFKSIGIQISCPMRP